MITFKEFLTGELILEGEDLELYQVAAPLLLLEDDVPIGTTAGDANPTPGTAFDGGWGRGPFNPGSVGGHWFSEFFRSISNWAISDKLKHRLQQLGVKGPGVDRVSQAAHTAAVQTRDLFKNPQKTIYRLNQYTIDTPKKVKIKTWNEAFDKQFKLALSKSIK